MVVTLDSKRRLTVPASIPGAAPGDHFEVRFDTDEDEIVFRRIATQGDWLAVLKECPVSMHDLPPRRRALPRHRKL
jgi:bifunctional DNA-binding transcriptional regulator/antitoxin component of YhaV-PrlF toxin-antitoxin module